MPSKTAHYGSLALFLLLVFGGGTVIGILNLPGAWYESLRKPVFNPPNWIFGPVWSVLYIMIAVAGWRLWTRARAGTSASTGTGAAMRAWWLQLLFNFLWSPVFFTAQRIDLALIVAVLMLLAILAVIALAWNRDRVSALLFLPYAAWVAFATLLNAFLWQMN
jgi:tryptophan-rich sensory protein